MHQEDTKQKRRVLLMTLLGVIALAAIMIGAYSCSSSHTEDMLHDTVEYDGSEDETDGGSFTGDNDWEDDNKYDADEHEEDEDEEEDEDSNTPPSTSSKKRKPYIDEPDVDDYSDPEEFYYYHPYDFLDFEDAENYYYEHGRE